MSDITVYSTPTCPWCQKAKEYLEGKSIEFDSKDVSSDSDARDKMVEKSGQMGVPVLDIKGKIIVGFDQAAIDEALKGE